MMKPSDSSMRNSDMTMSGTSNRALAAMSRSRSVLRDAGMAKASRKGVEAAVAAARKKRKNMDSPDLAAKMPVQYCFKLF